MNSINLSACPTALASQLIAFEREMADRFNEGIIKAPVHLSGGNEQYLIDYFRRRYDAQRGDWVCTAWRSHYHALLAGVPPTRLRDDILAGKSITLTYPEHRFISSAIVGGILPIALGLAMATRQSGSSHRVHVFVGDMTARTGTYHEVLSYAAGHNLPLNVVVETNGKSVGTPTPDVWKTNTASPPDLEQYIYDYELPFPHAGAGKWVKF